MPAIACGCNTQFAVLSPLPSYPRPPRIIACHQCFKCFCRTEHSFGEGVKNRSKEKLLTECNLHTGVRLPNGVFASYTGTKINLLFFTNGEPTTDVWFYRHLYPEGQKSCSKTRPIHIEEFDVEKAWWTERQENEFTWKASTKDIAANGCKLDIKNAHNADTGLGDPDELRKEFHNVNAEAASVLEALKQELASVLSSKDE